MRFVWRAPLFCLLFVCAAVAAPAAAGTTYADALL